MSQDSSNPIVNASTSSTTTNEDFTYPICADFKKYELLFKIGQGTYGEVFKSRLRKSPTEIVALKKVLMENEKEGFPITALREIRILQELRHQNIVRLIEICLETRADSSELKTQFYMVFEFCEHDLAGLLNNKKVPLSLGNIKNLMKQLLNGLFYIHWSKVLHRDLKSANILITKSGVLKLADFGLSRAYSHQQFRKSNCFTNRVVTLWYRPPELLLGERHYGTPVDMWGVGCIMAEMYTRHPLLQGDSEQHQIQLISQLCGSITPEVWPDVVKLELFRKMQLPKYLKRELKGRMKAYVEDNYALDLLDKLLILDPEKRIGSDAALNHDFFWIDPETEDLSKTLSEHSQSMFNNIPVTKPRKRPAAAIAVRPLPHRMKSPIKGQFDERIY